MDQTEPNSLEKIKPPLSNSGSIEEFQSPKSYKPLIIGLVILVVLLTTAMAYVYAQNQSLKSQLDIGSTCEYEGATYKVGEGFTASDGCNSCSCTKNGQVACTAMACLDDDEGSQIDPTADWETYTNPNEGISFKYPVSWTVATGKAESGDVLGSEYDSGLRAGPFENDIPTPYVLSVRTHLNETDIENIIDILEPGVLVEYRPTYSKFKVGDLSGYISYSFSSMYGQVDVFLPIRNNMVQITLWPFDKNNPYDLQEQAWNDFSQILSTFEFSDSETLSTTKTIPSKNPTAPPSTTYTDQEFGYQVSYNPETWMFRHTYGRGGISNSDTSGNPRVNSGFDLHRPSNINPNAVIILNVFEAYGETDIDSWIEQYELNIPSGATSQYIQSDSMKAKEYTFKYDQQDGFDRRLRFFIYEGNVYKMWYSELGQINAEVQNIVETFTP